MVIEIPLTIGTYPIIDQPNANRASTSQALSSNSPSVVRQLNHLLNKKQLLRNQDEDKYQ